MSTPETTPPEAFALIGRICYLRVRLDDVRLNGQPGISDTGTCSVFLVDKDGAPLHETAERTYYVPIEAVIPGKTVAAELKA